MPDLADSDTPPQSPLATSEPNSASLTSHLPPEILCNIFLALASTVTRNGKTTGDLISWFLVTHVCREWREVGISCAALWSNFTFEEPTPFLRVMVQRAKNAPVDLFIALDCDVWIKDDKYAIFTDLLSQTNRIHSIALDVSPAALWRRPDSLSFDHIPKGGLPVLETLHLTYFGPTRPLPLGHIVANSPSLKYLQLRGYTIEWESLSAIPTLTHLDLHSCVEEAAPKRPSAATLLKTLDHLPHLRTLIIYNLLPLDDPCSIPNPKRLQKLHSLKLSDGATAISIFLESLGDFRSEEVNLCIVGEFGLDGVSQLCRCISLLSTVWKNPSDSQRKFQAGMRELRAYNLDSYPILKSWFGRRGRRRPDLTIERYMANSRLTPAADSVHRRAFFRTILDRLDRSHLTSLRVSNTPFHRSTWRTLFGGLPRLRTIHFTDNFTFCDFIGAMSTRPGRLPPSRPYFPALSVIQCSELDFDVDGCQDMASHTVIMLAETLKQRPPSHRIRELRVKDCINFGENEHKHLAEAVDNLKIVWDGLVYLTDNSDSDFYDREM